MSIKINKKKELQQLKQVANLSTYTTEPFRCYNSFCYDDDDYEESTIPLNEIVSQILSSNAITPVLPTIENPEDSLIIGNKDFSTIPEKESDEFIKSSVEDFILIPWKIRDFSNPLFDSNDDFTSSDDESLSDEDVPEDNVNIYSNPLFEFDDKYISSDVNPLFDEVLEDIERKDEYFDPVDEIEFLLHHDPSTPKMTVVSILKGFTNEPPLKENDDLFDLKSKMDEWKKILHDAPIDDLMTEDKFFEPRGDIDEIDAFLDINISTNIKDGYYDSKGDVLYLERLLTDDTTPNPPPEVFLDHNLRSLSDINDLKIMVKISDHGIHEKFFSLTYVRLAFKDRHYLFFTYVI
nr:hypothetical protein [Tanacetum cinerariifolium]